MKLNMWMIANRLSLYETEIHFLDENEKHVTLNSVLPIFVPGSVRISGRGSDLVCENSGEVLLIHDVPLSDGYMLIQNIFNWYQDWCDQINTAAYKNDYSYMAGLMFQVFQNPVMIQDSNYRLLGMAGIGEKEPPSEWRYICDNGQSSVDGYLYMADLLLNAEKQYDQNVKLYHGNKEEIVKERGLHASVRFLEKEYLKINVIESNRTFNMGDVKILEYLSRHLAIYCAASNNERDRYLESPILNQLLSGEDVDEKELEYFDSIVRTRQEDTYAILCVGILQNNKKGDERASQIIHNLVKKHYPSLTAAIYMGYVVILLCDKDPRVAALQIIHMISLHGYEKSICAGMSLTFHHLLETHYFYMQARAAMDIPAKEAVRSYYRQALYDILDKSGIEQVCMCEPRLRYLWENEQICCRKYIETLKIYLEEERSSKRTCARLFIHKNTLTYRIKCLTDRGGWDFNDTYERKYLLVSLYVLNK
ncbi:MAG: helix-turn-helix domain-containing protein [Anaerobutyricum sp.]|nr:helix-turn-helix domain-containing protein [Anaerobutyricum sp.]